MVQVGGEAYRIKVGDKLLVQVTACLTTNNASVTYSSKARVIYDDGEEDLFVFSSTVISGVASGSNQVNIVCPKAPHKDGWIVEWGSVVIGSWPRNSIWATFQICTDAVGNGTFQVVGSGPHTTLGAGPTLGRFQDDFIDLWPLWVFQGTVAEDATVGTHTCTLTVTPTTGLAMEIEYGQIIATGAAGLVQSAVITDGTNVIATIFAATAAGTYAFPGAIAAAAGASAGQRFLVQGGQKLVLTAATSTVSDTQTFSVACRINPKGIPTATLADSTGTPTLTTNTNATF